MGEIRTQKAHSPLEVFLVFMRLGVTSFGGPTAHLGYFHEEFVTRRRWLDDHHFASLQALCQFLPGPTSSQLGFAIGLVRAGIVGALTAWVAFTLPSVVIMLCIASGAMQLDGTVGDDAISGLKAAAVAVVAYAVWGMARTLTPDLRRIGVGVGAATIVLFLPVSFTQLIAIAVGAGAGLLVCAHPKVNATETLELPISMSRPVALWALGTLSALLIGLPLLATFIDNSWLGLTDAFIRAGALVFGGGHVLLPLLQAEPALTAVVSQDHLIAGYGAAQALPGPLFALAAHVGMIANQASGLVAGVLAGVLAVICVFLPGLLFVVGAIPFWVRLHSMTHARAMLRGANAAVVGVLAATLAYPLVPSGITDPLTLAIALCCLLLLALRIPVWVSVLLGAVVGGASTFFG